MLKIRLHRRGRKKNPFYRIIVIDQRTSRDGKYIEKIGIYSPGKDSYAIINRTKLNFWRTKGAQVNISVKSILKGLNK